METNNRKNLLSRIWGLFVDHTLFSAVYLIAAVLWFFPYLGGYMNYVMKGLFVWGACMIAVDIFTKRISLTGHRAVWLILFCFSYGVTILLNTDQLYDGVKHMIYNGILLFIIYPPRKEFDYYYQKKLPLINDTLILIGFIASAISIGMYVARYSHVIVSGDMVTGQGIYYNRLHGVYTSANTGALFSAVTIMLSIINRYLNKEHFKKFAWFYIFNAILQFLYYSATLSNGGFLAYVVLLLGSIFFLLFPYLRKHCKLFLSILLTLIVLSCSVFVLQGLTLGARRIMAATPNFVSTVQEWFGFDNGNGSDMDKLNNPDNQDDPDNQDNSDNQDNPNNEDDSDETDNGNGSDMDKPNNPDNQDGPDNQDNSDNQDNPNNEDDSDETDNSDETPNFDRVEENGDITNGRIGIWESGIAVMKHSLLFGIADADIYDGDKLTADIDETQLTEENIYNLKRINGYMHNALIQILVCAGIFGLLLFSIFAVLLAKDYLVALVRFFRSKYFLPLASIFVFILVLLSQAFSEGHILFNRQDPFAILFWLYLGVGMQMIEFFKTKTADTELYVCDTPYQVVNAMNLAKNSEKADIYIYDQFSTANTLAENLKKTDLFEHVILYKKYRSYPNLLQKMVTVFRIFAPHYTLTRHRIGKASGSNYCAVYVSYFTPFTDSVKLANPQAELRQYEDGIGSYYIGNLESFARSGVFSFINKFILNGKLSYDINNLYLNHPECYAGDRYEKLIKAPTFSDTNDMELVFGYKENRFYTEAPFIYLTQPLEETAIGAKAKEIEDMILRAVQSKVLLRVHPRQSHAAYAGFKIDTAQNLWELESAKQITDEHTLIGAFSTAQFTPKMLFDKEPTVIFTYKLYGDGFLSTTEQMIEMLKRMYRDPSKILVIESTDELQRFFDEAANK